VLLFFLRITAYRFEQLRNLTMSEFEQKMAAAEALLRSQHLDALVLKRVSSVAWATCGAPTHVNTAAETGVATLVIKPSERHLITSRIEAPRLEMEEGLARQGWTFHVGNWYEGDKALAQLTVNGRAGADVPLPGMADLADAVSAMRSQLLPEEQARMRELGTLCAAAMRAAIQRVKPGQSEQEIAAGLAYEAQSRGVQAIVNLIATDERIYNYRHPLPTDKELDKYAMLVLCGRKHGLVCSITRLIHFGPLPSELQRKMEAVAQIDATFINATRPGATLGEIFAKAQAQYAATGFADEWQLHHQGGPVAYEAREVIATPDMTGAVTAGQGFAWNPSVTGTKSEDTFLVGKEGNELLTVIDGWPALTVEAEGVTIQRPAVLVV
jgi:antitoxin VapB